jgi:hypothetical protein
MVADGLLVFSKAESLFYRIYPSLINYPRGEKYSTVAAIKDNFIGFLTRINQANSVKSKRIMYLQEADACLQTLKMLFRLSVNKKFIKQAFYEDISESLTEVNKLLVGYFKSASNKDYKSNFSK